jgi:hypothetical protein
LARLDNDQEDTMKRILGEDWLLPELDTLNREWFTRGRICIQLCNACGETQHPPEVLCQSCGSQDSGWQESKGAGRIESFTRVHHPVHPSLVDQCPYTVLVVSLDDVPGIHVVGNLKGDAAAPLAIGQAVRAVFEEIEDPEFGPLQIPQWELTS